MNTVEKLNRLCKWRSVLVGWQLGTRPAGDPEAQAVRDQRDVLMLLRCEVNALARLCIDQGVFSPKAWAMQLGDEADALNEAYRQRFPGMEATELGIRIVDPEKAAETTRGWRP